MTVVTLEEAQAGLVDIVHKLAPGEEIVITENNQAVAKLVAMQPARMRPEPGLAKGMLTILVDDDEHLEMFKEYMP